MQSLFLNQLALRAAFLLVLLAPVAIGAPAGIPSTQPPAEAAPQTAGFTPDQAETSSPAAVEGAQLLDEQELAELAALDEEPGDEVIGGALSNQHLTYVAIALAAAVVVLVLK